MNSIDLSGDSSGSISQTFATLPGVKYNVSFDMSANPDTGPRVFTMLVTAGSASQSYSYNTGAEANSSNRAGDGDMQWKRMSIEFTADSYKTTLTFADTSITPENVPAYAGSALDNVAATALYGTVCHRNSGKAPFKTMTFTDMQSVRDHLGHGDAFGPCK